MCTCSPENQPFPGLQQKNSELWAEEGDAAPVTSHLSAASSTGVLNMQHRPVRAGPEKGHENC